MPLKLALTFRSMLVCLALGSVWAIAPFHILVSLESGVFLVAPFAHAASGSGKEGDGSDDSESNSGSGSSSSGSGSGSDDSDDRDDSDSRDDDDERDDDDGFDDDSDDDDGDSSRGKRARVLSISKIELTGRGVVVSYSDGSIEQIDNGRYERTDKAGRRVERRVARGADLARLTAISRGIDIQSVRTSRATQSFPTNVTVSGGDIEVSYSTGWTERIASGRYELVDRYDRVVAQRPATEKDWKRLAEAGNR